MCRSVGTLNCKGILYVLDVISLGLISNCKSTGLNVLHVGFEIGMCRIMFACIPKHLILYKLLIAVIDWYRSMFSPAMRSHFFSSYIIVINGCHGTDSEVSRFTVTDSQC